VGGRRKAELVDLTPTTDGAQSKQLTVSLVVTLKNEAATLEPLIASVLDQTRQPDEVIVVDGGSADGTQDVYRRLTQGDPRFVLIDPGPASIGTGRNIGIEAAN